MTDKNLDKNTEVIIEIIKEVSKEFDVKIDNLKIHKNIGNVYTKMTYNIDDDLVLETCNKYNELKNYITINPCLISYYLPEVKLPEDTDIFKIAIYENIAKQLNNWNLKEELDFFKKKYFRFSKKDYNISDLYNIKYSLNYIYKKELEMVESLKNKREEFNYKNNLTKNMIINAMANIIEKTDFIRNTDIEDIKYNKISYDINLKDMPKEFNITFTVNLNDIIKKDIKDQSYLKYELKGYLSKALRNWNDKKIWNEYVNNNNTAIIYDNAENYLEKLNNMKNYINKIQYEFIYNDL